VSVLVLLLAAASQAPGDLTVIRGGRLVTLAGPDIEKGTLILEGGKIRKLGGPDLAAPTGAEVIELPASSRVLPGFVDAHSHLGSSYEVEESTESITTEVKAVEAFTSRHREVREALGSGVTTVALAPGSGNLIGGWIGVVKLNGARYDRALYRDSVALKGSLTEDALRRDREPTSRAGATRMLRDFLDGWKRSSHPFFVAASTASEIHAALEAAGEGVRVVLVGGREGGSLAEEIRLRTRGVAFGPLTVNDRRSILETPGRLARAGIPVAFVTDAPRTSEELLRVSAAFAVKHGMEPSAALRALTTVPAGFLGLDTRVGSLEEGKDADVVVWSGDPLALPSSVDLVVVGGRVTWRKERK